MRHFKKISVGTGLTALLSVLAGCESIDQIQDPPTASKRNIGAVGVEDSSDFDRELIQAKLKNTDPAQQDKAMKHVLDKYGLAYKQGNGIEESGPVEPPNNDAPSLVTAARTTLNSFNPVRRDFSANGVDLATFVTSLNLKNGESLAAVALGKTASVDPFLIAYYSDPFGTPKLSYPKVVAYNDDAGAANRNSVIQWTNNTGVVRVLVVIAFAYSTSTSGLGNVIVNTSTSSNVYFDQPIGGYKRFGGNPLPDVPNNCVFKKTQMRYSITSGDYNNFRVIAIDNMVMKGGGITGFPSHFLDLNWQVNNPYPSFVLFHSFGGPSNIYSLSYKQTDMYTCIQ